MNRVRMYCTEFCVYCRRAEWLLERKGADIEKIPVTSSTAWEEMSRVTGRNTVPQIYIGDTHVGGYDELAALEDAGELDPLLGKDD